MGTNHKDYDRTYRKAYRENEKGLRDDLAENKIEVKFETKKIKLNQFKKLYKNKILNKEQQYIFDNCLDLIELVNASKECLEIEGAYVKTVTGTLKVNPAQKELRENLKAFTSTLQLLQELLKLNDTGVSMEEWLDDD